MTASAERRRHVAHEVLGQLADAGMTVWDLFPQAVPNIPNKKLGWNNKSVWLYLFAENDCQLGRMTFVPKDVFDAVGTSGPQLRKIFENLKHHQLATLCDSRDRTWLAELHLPGDAPGQTTQGVRLIGAKDPQQTLPVVEDSPPAGGLRLARGGVSDTAAESGTGSGAASGGQSESGSGSGAPFTSETSEPSVPLQAHNKLTLRNSNQRSEPDSATIHEGRSEVRAGSGTGFGEQSIGDIMAEQYGPPDPAQRAAEIEHFAAWMQGSLGDPDLRITPCLRIATAIVDRRLDSAEVAAVIAEAKELDAAGQLQGPRWGFFIGCFRNNIFPRLGLEWPKNEPGAKKPRKPR